MTNLDNPNYRRDLERAADQEGMSTGAWAGVAFLILLLGGVAFYTYSTPGTNTAGSNQPGIEQPATVGQGGARSKMPVKE